MVCNIVTYHDLFIPLNNLNCNKFAFRCVYLKLGANSNLNSTLVLIVQCRLCPHVVVNTVQHVHIILHDTLEQLTVLYPKWFHLSQESSDDKGEQLYH